MHSIVLWINSPDTFDTFDTDFDTDFATDVLSNLNLV